MGRQQYLTRLALGRSAWDGECHSVAVDNQRDHADEETPAIPYTQQYDRKGRPVNLSTEARNTALRHAENAALALVGVVERKDNHDRLNELKYRTIRLAREDVLAAEQDAGENLDLLITLLTFLNYASGTLLGRVQAGLYPSSDSFAAIISRGLSAMREAGVRGGLAVLFPGAPAAMCYATTRVLLGATLSTGVEYFSNWLIRQKLRTRTARRVNHALYFVCEAILIALDASLLPLEYYAYAQRLGLAPSRPLLPSLKILLPSSPTSLHHFGWQSRLTLPILNRLCSPAALMLLQTTLWREQDAEIPIATQLTRFQYPDPFNAPSWTVRPPQPTHDPVGWLFYQGFTLRTRILRTLGYTLEHHSHHPKHEADRPLRLSPPSPLDQIPDDLSSSASWTDGGDTTPKRDDLQHIHRSTDLARAAPKLLADRLDLAFARFLLLPLHALVARSVAHAYISHPLLPKTPFAIRASPHLYAPFQGPLTLGAAGEWAPYLSKLGLSLALHAANTLGTFFLVAALARWQGRRWYDWGAEGSVGGLVYPAEGEE